jgi:APA family basic amino acid/polyamine antiporter
MTNLSLTTWLYFAVWLALGTIVYFVYSRKHSTLQDSKLSGSKSRLKIIARLGNTLLK